VILLVTVVVKGLSWPLLYWLAVSLVGVWLEWGNIRHILLGLHLVRSGEESLRALTLGYVFIQLLLGLFLALSLLVGAGLTAASLVTSLTLEFTSRMLQYVFIGLMLFIPTAGFLGAALFSLARWRALRAMDRRSADSVQ